MQTKGIDLNLFYTILCECATCVHVPPSYNTIQFGKIQAYCFIWCKGLKKILYGRKASREKHNIGEKLKFTSKIITFFYYKMRTKGLNCG